MAKPTNRRSSTTKPNCTHVKMGLLRVVVDDQTCDNCGKRPYLRVFFSCEEDGMKHGQPTLPSSVLENLEPKVHEMQQLGMSKSVISQAQSGKYTDTQLDKLIQLRKGVITAIEQKSSGSAIMHSHSTAASAQVGGELSSKAKTNYEDSKFFHRIEKAKKPRANHKMKAKSKCKTKICYACRPHYKDRAFQSIDSIVIGDVPSTSDLTEELTTKPMSSPKVVQRLGLPKPFFSSATRCQPFATAITDTTITTSSSSSIYSEVFNWQSSITPPTSPKSTDSLHMQELEHQLHEMKGVSSPSILSDLVSSLHQNQLPMHNSSVTCSNDAILLKLKGKAPNQVNRMGSSVSLPVCSAGSEDEHTTSPLQPRISRANTERSSISDVVEVEGGVALTEEAVEMQTPDLITQD